MTETNDPKPDGAPSQPPGTGDPAERPETGTSGAPAPMPASSAGSAGPSASSDTAAPVVPAPSATAPPAPARAPRRLGARSLLAALLLVIGSLGIIVSGVLVWAHQTLLDSDRYASIVAQVSQDPDVIAGVSDKLAEGIVTAVDVQGRLVQVLPGPAAMAAAPITDALERQLEEFIATAFANPDVQRVWVDANRVLHQQVIAFLRGDTTALQIRDGIVYLDVYPIIDAVLRQLQTMGIIPADTPLPDVSGFSLGTAGRALLETALGVTLPEDFGAIPLFEAERLQRAAGLIQAFDIVTILSVVITALFLLGAVWLARRRLRMVLAVGLGAIVALSLLSLAIRTARDTVVAAIADPSGSLLVGGLFDVFIADLRGFLLWVVLVAAIVVLAAYLLGRPRWLELVQTDDRGAWLSANTGYLRSVALAVVTFLVIGFVVSWPLAIFLAAIAALVELTIQAVREPRFATS